MAQLRSARVVLDRQVTQVLRQSDDEQRRAAIRGALNGFGAMTGQPLSFLIEVERRSMIAGSDEARALSRSPADRCAAPRPCSHLASCWCSTAA